MPSQRRANFQRPLQPIARRPPTPVLCPRVTVILMKPADPKMNMRSDSACLRSTQTDPHPTWGHWDRSPVLGYRTARGVQPSLGVGFSGELAVRCTSATVDPCQIGNSLRLVLAVDRTAEGMCLAGGAKGRRCVLGRARADRAYVGCRTRVLYSRNQSRTNTVLLGKSWERNLPS